VHMRNRQDIKWRNDIENLLINGGPSDLCQCVYSKMVIPYKPLQVDTERQTDRRQETDVTVLIVAFSDCFMKLTEIVIWHCVKRNAMWTPCHKNTSVAALLPSPA
jgi:hypothetical protein